jgi:4-azaleucine resistance transporter AzlC
LNHPLRAEFLKGVRDQLPILVGVFPFGLVFGALGLATGLTPAQTQGLSLFVFGGSSQFVAVQLIGQGAAPLVIILSIWLVNLRHALYSASLAPFLSHLPRRWKLGLAWLLTDEAFAMTYPRYRRGDTASAHGYMLGSGLALWACWQLSTGLGIVFGARIPESWSLDFVLPLTFLALLIPTLVDRPAWAAAVSGGTLSLVLRGLPYGLGLVIATVAAVAVGVAAEKAIAARAPTEAGNGSG